jgi:site-specific recombinase XerD
MSRLRTALDEYLALRRALGYKLYRAGLLLQQFVEFAEQTGAAYITTDLALKWATQPKDAQQPWWAERLGVVRRFAEYCASGDARTVIPSADLLPYAYRRISPHLYQNNDIRHLLKAAQQLPSRVGLRPHTYATLFGLYVSTGLRTSEPLGLDRDDVDLLTGVLTIRGTKFGKSRYVAVHPSTQRALQRYARLRDRLCHNPDCQSFFLSDQGRRLSDDMVRWTFIKLSRQIGMRKAGDSHGPRIHDFRHRLAITRLTQWHRRGVDVERHLPQLCAFLGHAHITDTQWYLTATPQLLRYALRRVERSERKSRL